MAIEVLLTGHTGFIGRRLQSLLTARGYCPQLFSSNQGDIARTPLRFPAVRHVIHLAGRSFVPDSWRTPLSFYETNVLGALNVLELCRAQGASLTLVSSYIYGQPRRLPVAEDYALEPANPYAHSKLLAEEAADFYTRTFGTCVTVVRPFNIYGPGQDRRFLIPLLVSQAVDPERDVIEVADGQPRRDYLYVDDFAELLLLTIGRQGGSYNAGSGASISVEELARLICRVAGVRKKFVSRGERRTNEIPDVVADISRAARDLGWKPATRLEQGIAAVVREMAGVGGPPALEAHAGSGKTP